MNSNELSLSLSELNIPLTVRDFLKQMCKEKQYDIIRGILKYYIPTEPIDDDGNTILHFIISNFGNMGMTDESFAQLLSNPKIKKIIDLENKTDGNTPAVLACSLKLHNIVGMLEQAGADIHKPSRTGACVETVVESEQHEQQPKPTQEDDNKVYDRINAFFQAMSNRRNAQPMSDASLTTLGMSQTTQSPKLRGMSINIEGGSELALSTEAFINKIVSNANASNSINSAIGGAKKSGQRTIAAGQRQLNHIPDFSGGKKNKKENKKNKKEDTEISRGSFEIGRITDDIHERVIETIKSLMNVDAETAKIYKSVIYYRVKKEHPEYSGYERATEMEKLATKSILKEIDVEAERKLIEEERKKHSEQKSLSESSSESDSDKKSKKKKSKSKSESESSSESDESEKKTKKSKEKKGKSLKTSTSSSSLDMTLSM